MPKVSFDGTTKIISVTEDPVGGEVSLDCKVDLYSDWKEWVLQDDNSKYEQALRAVGGDPLPGSKALGVTYFMMNGWKIRPYESNHTLNVNGNLYCEDGSSPYVATLGAFNIMVISAVSSLVDSTVQQLPEIEYASFNGGVTIDVVNGAAGSSYPLGTEQAPVNNLADAKAIAIDRGFKTFHIKGNFTLGATDNVSGYTLIGEDSSSTMITLTAGCNTIAAKMKNLTLTGTCGGRMDITDSHLSEIVGLCASGGNANITRCMLMGNIQMRSIADQTFNFVDCFGSADEGGPVLDVNGCSADINIADYSGHLTLRNMDDPNQELSLDIGSGHLTLDATITQGILSIGGIAKFTDDTTQQAGLTVDTSGLLTPSTIEHMAFNEMVHLDVTNGQAGTAYPVGTHRHPVNNLADAKTIAGEQGLGAFHVAPNLTIGASESVNGFTLRGFGADITFVTLSSGCTTSGATFEDMTVSGRQSGETHYTRCDIGALSNVHCLFRDCRLIGPMTMHQSYADTTVLVGCYGGDVAGAETIIDLNNSPVNMSFSGFYGKLKFINMNKATAGIVSVNMDAGKVTIDASCTTGTIKVRGTGELVNNTGGTIVDNDLVNPATLEDLHDAAMGEHEFNPSTMKEIKKRKDGTLLRQFALTEATGAVPVVIKRTPE